MRKTQLKRNEPLISDRLDIILDWDGTKTRIIGYGTFDPKAYQALRIGNRMAISYCHCIQCAVNKGNEQGEYGSIMESYFEYSSNISES